jgi:glycerol-3-phosphate dehydrogenase
MARAFQVHDASMDSFDLLHALADGIRHAGGQVWLRHRVEGLIVESGRVAGAEVCSLLGGEVSTIGAEMVVNASGPWSRQVAGMANVELPIALGKGTMVAMASRLVHTVLNRLKPPSDGDIIVPVGTVAVLGTTDVPVDDPADLSIEAWEIDLLLAEGEILIPGLSAHRALRAWAGIRPLYRPSVAGGEATRILPRAHTILDHAERDGVAGLVSVIGGKLTTFRLMAEQTMEVVCRQLGVTAPCKTAATPLEKPVRPYFTLPDRWKKLERARHPLMPPEVMCECESVTRSDLEAALQAPDVSELDDVRRDLRLGMGPCQAAFCAYRAAGLAQALGRPGDPTAWLLDFLEERWRGTRPLGWGQGLRQAELARRLYLELFAADRLGEGQTR